MLWSKNQSSSRIDYGWLPETSRAPVEEDKFGGDIQQSALCIARKIVKK